MDVQKEQVANPLKHLHSNSKKKLAILAPLITIAILFTVFTGGFLRDSPTRLIVIRVDDIQDFAFREAQFFLIKNSIETGIPLSLAIITGMFGEDVELLEGVQKAVASGCEVGVHGWQHENLANCLLNEQISILFQAKSQIKELLGIDTRLLIPPMFSFDNNTIYAMHEEAYSVMSTCTDYHEPGYVSGIKNIPATVELSILPNNVWQMKSVDSVKAEVERSFELYGYAVVVTHLQEFMLNRQLNQSAKETYSSLLSKLGESCHFSTFEKLP